MQVILGAGGVIGRGLSSRLAAAGHRVRQAGRSPRPVGPDDEVATINLLDAAATARAVAGCEVAYLTAGLKYDTAVWQDQWPRIMRHVIDACARHRCRLVFFDNVYAYGRVDGAMTEDTSYNPCSRKGEVRARVATMLMDEVRRGTLEGMIVRAADFYGPGATMSVTHATVIERLRAGKAPQWLGNPRKIHTFTYTPDAAASLALLGNTSSAYGQIWHCSTSLEPVTGEAFVRMACELAGRRYRLQTAPRWLVRILGLGNPVLRETVEMMYQFDEDYRFDSSKIARTFNLSATSYHDGLQETLRAG